MSSCLGLPDPFGELGRHIQLYKHGIPMNHSRTAIASGLLAFALIAPAHADVLEGSAFASITNVTIQLQDENPLDGITPSVTWTSPSTWTVPGTAAKPYALSVYNSISTADHLGRYSYNSDNQLAPAVGANIFTPTSSSLTNGAASSQGLIASNGISSQVHVSIDEGEPTHDQEKTADAIISPADSYFVLSPFTRITITGSYATSVASAGAGTWPTLAQADAGLWLGSDPTKYLVFNFQSDRFFAPDPTTGEAFPGDPTPKNGTFTLTLSNTTPNSTHGSLNLRVSTYAMVRSVSSVPEPETIALMLAGLGAVAATRQRQQKVG